MTDLKNLLSNKYDYENFKKIFKSFFNIFNTNVFEEENNENFQIILKGINSKFKSAFIEVKFKDNFNNIKKNKTELYDLLEKITKKHLTAENFICVFYSENEKIWQLNFIKKTINQFKRYFYILGENIAVNTAVKQLGKFVGADSYIRPKETHPINKVDTPPKEGIFIKEIFSPEFVVKEFYAEFKKIFDKFNEYSYENHINLQHFVQFEDKKKAIRDFNKKLLSKMVFINFLQKKILINNDENYLYNLYLKCKSNNEMFFNEYLENLFYELLNKPPVGADLHLTNLTICKDSADLHIRPKETHPDFAFGKITPPEEGILIKENNDNSPVETRHRLVSDETLLFYPNDLFENVFDLFNQYNFTIDENDSENTEIAIDPEILGYIFENLLEDNKDKGTFYTPKIIVDYMTKTSLIEYLKNNFEEKYHQILEEIVKYPDESFAHKSFIAENKNKILYLLDKVKIIDPAIGSGAFPVSVLFNILKIKEILNPNLNRAKEKKKIIENSIYGIDIEQGAIDITKLRFCLSLIAEGETLKTLPDFDYKFICSNSLLTKFEGEVIDVDINNLRNIDYKNKLENEFFPKLKELLHNYFNKTECKNESELKIKNLKTEIIEIFIKDKAEMLNTSTLKTKADLKNIEKIKYENILNKLELIKRDNKLLNFFDYNIDFYNNNSGFDIVIGNPPYVGEKSHKEIFRQIREGNLKEYYQGKQDLFYFFFHLAFNLLKKDGLVTFITTNYFITATGAKKLREDIFKRAVFKKVINFNELKIFESALNQHNMITILQKSNNKNINSEIISIKRTGYASLDLLDSVLNKSDTQTDCYFVNNNNIFDGNEYYLRFQNISSVNIPIDNILNKTESKTILLDEICNINQGIVSGCDKVTNKHIKKYSTDFNIGDGIFVLSEEQSKLLNSDENDKKLLKPWFKNSDIYKWITNEKSFEKIIYADKKLQNLKNSNLLNHLLKYKIIIDNSSDNSPYLHRPRKINFSGPKIVVPQRNTTNKFGYNECEWYSSADVYYITIKNKSFSLKYILALLNSKLYYFWLLHKGKNKGSLLELYQKPLSEIPVFILSEIEQKPFIEIVDKIISAKKENFAADITDSEKQIDNMIYKLYGLTKSEIEIVEM